MDNNQRCIRLFADHEQIDNCRQTLQANQLAFRELSKSLALAGNEVRLKILFLLEEENELCPCDLSDILGISIPAVSQHIRKLKDGNLIEGRRDGQTIFYSLKKDHFELLQPFFDHITHHTKTNQIIEESL